MKKIIGVLPLVNTQDNSLWMSPDYLNAIKSSGGLPVILPLTSDYNEITQLVSMCDGFLFTGGQDITPCAYKEEAIESSCDNSPERDIMELKLFKLAVQHNKRVLGIGRGMQLMNVALAGTLIQDISSEIKDTDISHLMTKPYNHQAHNLKIETDSKLFYLLGLENIGVNSLHHQAIKELSPAFDAMARADDDTVEAICMRNKSFVWGVMWHPEITFDDDVISKKIFRAFIG
ncbi:MAG: gamma-glutamyl-gamma-aminobutyrate hydrolase family protein [Treponemataceae bacterium]|nr:gamma-glutamyl-gamma-aminobutyrate hydrolase family protein [Treponemataceae bacterium]